MSSILLLKLALVPALIYLVSLAGMRWGPGVAGWLSAFPIISGPILLAVTLEQGAGFAATAAEGTLLAVVAILVFGIAYAWASERFGVAGAMSSGLLAYGIAVACLQATHPPLLLSFAVVWCALLVAPRLFPKTAAPVPSSVKRNNDLPWRMLAGAVLVLTVTFLASRIGARLSGFFAMFPVMSTVLVGFVHARSGRNFANQLLRGMTLGYFAFSVFCLTLSLLLREVSVPLAFGCAFGCALIVQIGARRIANMAPALSPAPGRR